MRGYGGAGHLKDGADSVAPRLLVLQPALLLEKIRLRTPPSRGDTPFELEVDVGPEVQTTELQYDLLPDIGWALALENARPRTMFGCAVLKRGKPSNHDMWLAGPPFVFKCVQV